MWELMLNNDGGLFFCQMGNNQNINEMKQIFVWLEINGVEMVPRMLPQNTWSINDIKILCFQIFLRSTCPLII